MAQHKWTAWTILLSPAPSCWFHTLAEITYTDEKAEWWAWTNTMLCNKKKKKKKVTQGASLGGLIAVYLTTISLFRCCLALQQNRNRSSDLWKKKPTKTWQIGLAFTLRSQGKMSFFFLSFLTYSGKTFVSSDCSISVPLPVWECYRGSRQAGRQWCFFFFFFTIGLLSSLQRGAFISQRTGGLLPAPPF